MAHIHIHQKKKTLCILFLFFALGGMSAVQQQLETRNWDHTIERGKEGTQEREERLFYRTEDGKRQEVAIAVSPQVRSASDAQLLLEHAVEEWDAQYLGENSSPEQVESSLYFPESLQNGLVQVSYESSNFSLLREDGTLDNENLVTEGELVELSVRFAYEDYVREEKRAVRVMPAQKGSKKWMIQQVDQALRDREMATRTESRIQLPDDINGIRISWEQEKNYNWVYFIFLGVSVVICLNWKERQDFQKQEEQRKQKLLWEYPGMVEQMLLLLGSGMSVMAAWEKMLQTDRTKSKSYTSEMWITCREIREGMGEARAYERFGERIGLMPYRRFGSILAQSLTKGCHDMQEILKVEAAEAFEMRKNSARRLGEEAGTKLLFPMMLMFGLILVILLMPAIQKF